MFIETGFILRNHDQQCLLKNRCLAKAQKKHNESKDHPETPNDSPKYENLQSFGLKSLNSRWSFKDKLPRDVLYSLP